MEARTTETDGYKMTMVRKTQKIAVIGDLFKGASQGTLLAEIVCPVQNATMRRLENHGDKVLLACPAEPGIWNEFDATTPIIYDPWVFDRGNILIDHPSRGRIKLCTEMDILRFQDGEERMIVPSDELERSCILDP